MGVHDLWLFLVAGFLLNITPGPDMALIIARSSQFGVRAGVAAALGVGAGAFVHIAAATVGLSALIMTSAALFNALKWMGTIYLIYIGIQIVRSAGRPDKAGAAEEKDRSLTAAQIFFQGFLTNALNPKVAIFFIAFLPQFVDPDAPSKFLAFSFLGLLFTFTGTLWNVAVAWFSGSLVHGLKRGRLQVWMERSIGALFIAVGLRLASSETP